MPFPLAYFLVLLFQGPVWLLGGLLWGACMVVMAGFHPASALIGGIGWGALMWLTVGNLFAVGFAWRRSVALPTSDRLAIRAALDEVCRKLRLIVLAESPDEIVLGPKWVLVRFRLQEARVRLDGDRATLTAPALSFAQIRKALLRALDEMPASGQ